MQGYDPNTAERLIALVDNPPPRCTEEQQEQLQGLFFAFEADGANEFQHEMTCRGWSWGEPVAWKRFETFIMDDRLRSTTPFRVCGARSQRSSSAASVPILATLLGDIETPGLAQLAPAFPDGRLPPVRPAAARRVAELCPFATHGPHSALQGAFSAKHLIGLYLHDATEALDFRMLKRLLFAAEHCCVYSIGFHFLRLCLDRLSPELEMRQSERALCEDMFGCIHHVLETHSLCSDMLSEALTLLHYFIVTVFDAVERAAEAGLPHLVCSILNERWPYSVPYLEHVVFRFDTEEEAFVQGFSVLRTMCMRSETGAQFVLDLVDDIIRACMSAAAWLATMPLEYVTPHGERSRWALMDYPGVMLTMVSHNGQTTHELMRFFHGQHR